MNNQEPILPEVSTPIEENVEQKSELELKGELTELVGSRETVLIVGAGSSKRLGYPDWQELLQEVEKLTTECDVDFKPNIKLREYKPLEYVDIMKRHIFSHQDGGRKYYALFDRLFGSKEILESELHFHKTLVSLPFRGFLTTNYDLILEDALQTIGEVNAHKDSFIVNENTAGQVHRFLLAMLDTETRGVAHLHGKYDDPERIVLGSEDYQSIYDPPFSREISKSNFFQRICFWILRREENQAQQGSKWTLHRKLLWAVLATRQVVFVGFSMKDPYFKKMLESVSNDLWRWDRSIHFAITSISSKNSEAIQARYRAAKFKRDYGIETLFYTDTDGKHQGLADIVYEVAKELGVSVPSDTMHPDLPGETRDGLNKVKQISQRMAEKIGDEN